MSSYVSKGKLHRIDDDLRDELLRFSDEQIDKLAEFMSVGFMNEDEMDKGDKILVLLTEPAKKVRKALRMLKALNTKKKAPL